jgi:hypothetical protein
MSSAPVLTLLMDPSRDAPPQPAEYYRRKAAEARRAAEGVTTAPVRKRLLDMAQQFEQLAETTERALWSGGPVPRAEPNRE